MRIIAGMYKGRKIDAPKGMGTRPTIDRVREAVMSSLASAYAGTLDDLVVLDAFAGSGAYGLETLSRGAKHCTFFDNDREAAAVLKKNIASLGIPARQAAVRTSDIIGAVERKAVVAAPVDVVFLDPPYATGPIEVAHFIKALETMGALCEDATIVYEHATGSFDFRKSELVESFELLVHKKYGKTAVLVIRRKSARR